MSKVIHCYTIRRGTPEAQPVRMPRRARITGIEAREANINIYAEVEHDADTRAFDSGAHTRSFVKVGKSELVPEGTLVGFDAGIHVYEVRS